MRGFQTVVVRRSRFALSAAALALSALAAGPAPAGMTSLWRMDETSGTNVPNSVAGGTAGTLFNGPTWTNDAERGQVLAFDGVTNYAAAGTIPALSTTTNFTWSFWSSSSQGANNNVMLGNRYDGGAGSSSWIKFTTSKFEYTANWATMHIDYADIGAGSGWMFHTVVKSGTTLTYYRNGAAGGTSTVTADMPTLPLRFGGDPTAERWGGRMDNVALFDHALSPAEVYYAMLGMYGRFAGQTATNFSDTFDGSGVDTARWDVASKGLESDFSGGYNAPAISNGQGRLSGTTRFNYWRGSTLATRQTFAVPAGGELRFDVDRISLAGSGTGWRSSLWMYADETNFVHFGQDNEGAGNGFRYNANNNAPIGVGIALSRAGAANTDYLSHRMSLVNAGAFAKMFVDGHYLGSQAVTFTNRIGMLLTGQARASGDTVAAVFDNAAASTRTFANRYDSFNGGTLDAAKWTVQLKGLENSGLAGGLTASVVNGELVIQGSAGNQYWYGVTLRSAKKYAPYRPGVFSVERDALDKSGSAVRSSLWLWADDTHFLVFSHNYGENGWQYNFADGARVTESTGGGVNIPAFDAWDNDPGRHEMKLVFTRGSGSVASIAMYLDGQLGATKTFNNWGNRDYYFMLSGMPRASGDTVYAAFDNVQVDAVAVEGTVLLVR